MHMLAVLCHHPLVVEMEELVENIRRSGRTHISRTKVNGAAANDKLHTTWARRLFQLTLAWRTNCTCVAATWTVWTRRAAGGRSARRWSRT